MVLPVEVRPRPVERVEVPEPRPVLYRPVDAIDRLMEFEG